MRIRHFCSSYKYDPRFRVVAGRTPHSEIGPDYVTKGWGDWTLGGYEAWEGNYED